MKGEAVAFGFIGTGRGTVAGGGGELGCFVFLIDCSFGLLTLHQD